jgi:hypothetical protein
MEASRQRARSRDPLLGGIALIVIGGLLLVAQFVPDVSRYIPLAIGLGLAALFVAKRDYGLLIAAGVVTGVGVGIVIASTAPGDLAGAGFLLALGSGFLAIWAVSYALRMRERHWWPLVPGLILVTIGAALAAGGGALALLNYWPVILIAIGLLLLGRWFLETRSAARDG